MMITPLQLQLKKKGGAVHTGSQGVVLASVAKYSNLSRSGKIPSQMVLRKGAAVVFDLLNDFTECGSDPVQIGRKKR
jgi:hypothetical protein